ncbi:MAG: OB-fold nucleic acid binding domain-containing protein [Ferrovibrio sp.]
MHLTARIFALGTALLIAGPATAQQQQQAAPATPPATPSMADPRAQQPQSQPIVPPAPQSPGQPQADKKDEPAKKPAPAPKSNNSRGTTRSMTFDVPPLVPISEIPRGKAVTIQGVVLSPQATTFVLNDGNSSQVIVIGPTWRDLTKVKPGDRVRVIGQLDPYGTPVFRAGSVLLENNRIVVVPPT